MISGVSYNVFNGEEHLLHSLRVMRKNVDYINLVVQFTSNSGNRASPRLSEIIHQAHFENLADTLEVYEPDLAMPSAANEHKKRNIGLKLAKLAGITHFMTMDCDEYYLSQEFARAKEFIAVEKIETSAVPTYLHIKRPVWRSKEPDVTCCSFLTKISRTSEIVFDSAYPVLVDPTRRLHGDSTTFHFFDTTMISMRHMNLVRDDDLRSKLANSSNAYATEFMANVRRAYDDWRFGDELSFPNKPPMQIIKVDDIFGIDQYFSKHKESNVR